MTRDWRACYALTLSMALLAAAGANAQQGAEQAVFTGDGAGVKNAEFLGELERGVDLVGYQPALETLSLGGAAPCPRTCFAGVDYLQVRASHSQQIAFVENNTEGLQTNDEFIRFHQFEFDYESSYRLYGGFRMNDCGQECRFTYTSFNSDASFRSFENSATRTIAGPFEVIPAGDGDRIIGNASVDLDNYDLACSKTIPLGSPLGCYESDPCCDTCTMDACAGQCGDACGCGCWCPAWDFTFTGAVRVADLSSQFNYANEIVSTAPPAGVPGRTAFSRVDFEGIGLRAGMLSRRYFGRSGMASVFIKGDISLLVGDLDYAASSVDADGSRPFQPVHLSGTQVIPVTEVEAGGTVALTKNVTLSGGYLFSAWHDLGHRAEYNYGVTTGNQVLSLDDANILAFDGWFLRAEATY